MRPDDALKSRDPAAGANFPAPVAARNQGHTLLLLLIGVCALAVLVWALLPSIGGFRTLLPALRQTRGGYLVAAIACQALMYVGVAGILRAGVVGGTDASLEKRTGEDKGSAKVPPVPSVADPRFIGAAAAFLWCNRALPGPAVVGLATLVFVLGRRGISAATAQASAATFYLADYVSFAAVSVVLLGMLAAQGRLAGLNTGLLSVAMGGIFLAMAATVILLRSPRLVRGWAERGAGKVARLLRRQNADTLATQARGLVDGFYERWSRIAAHPTALVQACAWGLFMHVGEAATVFFGLLAFQALPTVANGAAPSSVAGGLLTLSIASGAAYVAGNLAAIVSFLPAGLGAFEVAMAATLHLVGDIPLPQAALATLLYRLLSVWLPLPFLLQTARQALHSAKNSLRSANGEP